MSGKIEVGPEGNLDLHPTHHQHCHHHNDQGMNWQWQERLRQSRWVNWKAKAGLKRSPTAQHLHCILTQYLHSSFEFTLYLRCTPNQHLHPSFEFALYLRCTPKQNWHFFFEFRVPEIIRLPPRLASFRIISSESEQNSPKKRYFWYKNTHFGPFWSISSLICSIINLIDSNYELQITRSAFSDADEITNL